MALALTPIEDDIVERLGTLPQDIYVVEVPDDSKLPKSSNGSIKPYIVIALSGPYRSARGRGIVSSRHDLNIASLSVQVVAPTARAASQINDAVLDLLTGWSTTDTGEFTVEGGANGSNADTVVKPTKYFRFAFFSFRCNLTWE